MRSSYAWTMKPWQRSEWCLGFNSVLRTFALVWTHSKSCGNILKIQPIIWAKVLLFESSAHNCMLWNMNISKWHLCVLAHYCTNPSISPLWILNIVHYQKLVKGRLHFKVFFFMLSFFSFFLSLFLSFLFSFLFLVYFFFFLLLSFFHNFSLKFLFSFFLPSLFLSFLFFSFLHSYFCKFLLFSYFLSFLPFFHSFPVFFSICYITKVVWGSNTG